MGGWWLKCAALFLVLALLAWVAWNFFTVVGRVFVFYPDKKVSFTPAHSGLEYEDLWIRTPDGQRLHAWLVRDGSNALFLFCHGNAGDVGDRVENLALLVRAGVSVLIFDYRGYGRSTGAPTEEGVYMDAKAVYEYATGFLGYSPKRVVVFGRSLGAAVAAHLATQVGVAGVILESPFTNLKDMAWVHYPFIPGKFLVKHKFNVVEKVRGLRVPLLVVHGEKDGIVPLWMGEKVYQEAPGPKELYVVPGAGHNDTEIVGGEPYIQRLVGFVLRVTKEKG